jgi:hypothetical protein
LGRRIALFIGFLAAVFVAAGCAFDVVSVRQTPTTLTPLGGAARGFTLPHDLSVAIGTGFPTRLKQGTTWHEVGQIAQGDVYTTRDQVVMVEASNLHEAQLVVADGKIVGFYLPVEHTFTAAQPPLVLETEAK